MEKLKDMPLKELNDKDVWENSKTKLRFRKYPWVHWIVGGCWLLGVAWVLYELRPTFSRLRGINLVKQWALLAFAIFMGVVFLYTGKIRTTVFDREAGTLTIKKRNTCCDRRSIATYKLD